MNFENLNIWCWIIPSLVGIICGILGYLIGRSGSSTIDNSADLKLLKDKNAKLEADLAACNKKISSKAGAPKVAPKSFSSKTGAVAGVPFDKGAAKAALGKTIKQDDLKLVEGIGPKIEQLFHGFNIKTWKALSETPVAKCREVLTSGGDRFKMHDPSSWPMQAKMCYEGKWKELARWQDEHKGGRL